MSKQLEVQKAESRFTLDFIGRFGCNTYGGSATVTGSHVNLLSFFIIFDPGTRWEPRRSAPRARQRARVCDVRILSVSSGAPLESRGTGNTRVSRVVGGKPTRATWIFGELTP